MHCSELPSRMTYSYRECCRQAVLVCHHRNCPSWRVHWPRSHLLPGWPISNNKLTCATKSFPFRSPSGTSLKVIPSLELPTGSTESSISSIIVSASHCVQSCIPLFTFCIVCSTPHLLTYYILFIYYVYCLLSVFPYLGIYLESWNQCTSVEWLSG